MIRSTPQSALAALALFASLGISPATAAPEDESAALAAPKASLVAAKTEPCDVLEETTTYEVQLPARPQRRVWCTFRQEDRPGMRTVTFDPSVSDSLSQSITLPPGRWQMRCFAEPVTVVVEGAEQVKTFDLSWHFVASDWQCPDKPIEVEGTRMARDGMKAVEAKHLGEIRAFPHSARPTLGEAARQLATTGGGAAGGRSLDDTVPALVVDTLHLLAEIALERARGRAEALILQPLVKLACGRGPGAEDGTVRARLVEALSVLHRGAGRDAAERLLDALLPADKARLPATCAAIDGRTLAQLAESGPELADAIGRDLLRLSTRLAHHYAVGHLDDLDMPQTATLAGHAIDRLEATLARVVSTGDMPTPTEVQLVLVGLAGDAADGVERFAGHDATVALIAHRFGWLFRPFGLEWGDAPTPKAGLSDRVAVCSAALGFAVAAKCHGDGDRCDARTIADLVREPGELFDLELCEPALAAADLDWMPGWVARLTEVLMPPAGATPRDQARLALDVTFELLDRVIRPADGDRGERLESRRFAADIAAGLRTLSLGLVDQDGGRTVVGVLDLIRVLTGRAQARLEARAACTLGEKLPTGQECTEEIQERSETIAVWLRRSEHVLNRAVRVGSALVDNARSLKIAADDPAQAESQRAARKQTLESLIEAVTDRRWRGEDWVLSLGAGVGGLISPPQLRPDEADHWFALALAGGFAVQKLVPQDGWWGFHSQLTLVDLGYFLITDDETDIQWNDFVALGFQVGAIVAPSPDDAFIFGLDWRYLPGGRFARDMQLGLFVGYYVPFLDLN